MTVESLLLIGLDTLKEYLALHVLMCLVPAFFLAGAIASLFSKESVLRYFGADAPKYISYSVASVMRQRFSSQRPRSTCSQSSTLHRYSALRSALPVRWLLSASQS